MNFAREPEATLLESVEVLVGWLQLACVEEPSRFSSIEELFPETAAGVCGLAVGRGVGRGVVWT